MGHLRHRISDAQNAALSDLTDRAEEGGWLSTLLPGEYGTMRVIIQHPTRGPRYRLTAIPATVTGRREGVRYATQDTEDSPWRRITTRKLLEHLATH